MRPPSWRGARATALAGAMCLAATRSSVASWIRGRNRNLKFGVGRQHTGGLPDRVLVQIQLQIYYY